MINIKRAMKNRFGGRLSDKIKQARLAKNNFEMENNPLINAILKKNQCLIVEFFFGSNVAAKLRSKHNLSIYSAFCDMYTSRNDNNLFDFNGILLPKPIELKEQNLLGQEAMDFLIYELCDKSFCDAFTDEGPYERGNVVISPNDVVMDCGANMGLFSAISSRKGATVYAFEPSRHVINSYLSKTALLNAHIHICEYALSDKQEELTFIERPDFIAGGRLDKSAHSGYKSFDENSYNITIQAIPLDTFVHTNNIPQVDFIKADIEGAERYMLLGAKQVLKDFAPKIAICTYHLPDDPKVLRELILDANPNYVIEEKFKKMYAYVPE